ncbi:hypothetical protein NUW54_g14614 [Trametes sanguinea]|uniref:Uncharacterized protein n=1 Tax=Trametes sanguinea TaxID=158606 RepID=A0ACC1MBT8_9APHY|nr:hypothetical protein NUW54_g14614 [Trametes sanguinea]
MNRSPLPRRDDAAPSKSKSKQIKLYSYILQPLPPPHAYPPPASSRSSPIWIPVLLFFISDCRGSVRLGSCLSSSSFDTHKQPFSPHCLSTHRSPAWTLALALALGPASTAAALGAQGWGGGTSAVGVCMWFYFSYIGPPPRCHVVLYPFKPFSHPAFRSTPAEGRESSEGLRRV